MAMAVQTAVTSNPAKGHAGLLDATAPHFITHAINADSVSIPFGKAVVWDPSTPATDISVTLPANQTDPVMGIVVKMDHYAKAWIDVDGNTHGELDGTGLRPEVMMTVLRKGRILVTAATAVVAGVSRLYVRRTAGLGETLGALEDAADSTDMIDCTNQGVWVSTAGAGELAWLEVDFTVSPTVA